MKHVHDKNENEKHKQAVNKNEAL